MITRTKQMIEAANVVVPGRAQIEISHHYGIDQFDSVGAVLIDLINREYCKKLILMFPKQRHPEHCHIKKEETFLIVHGSITISLNGESRVYKRGDLLVVERNVRHSFYSENGVIMEELSSTHYPSDSYYTDVDIQAATERKTIIQFWPSDASEAKEKEAMLASVAC